MQKEQEYINKVKEWIVVNGADFVVNVLVFFLILIIGKIIINAVAKVLIRTLQKSKNVSEILQGFVVNVATKIMWVIVFMIGLQRLGIDIGPLIAGLGVTGFIVGFAFQESLGNLAAGLMLALNQPFKVEDYVSAAGVEGIIKELNMMATTIITLDNKKIVIPNNKVWGNAITNYTALETRRVDLAIGISYGSDIGQARKIINDALKSVPKVLADPQPDIEVVEMADSSVNLVVRPWCKTEDYWTVFFEANQVVKESLDKGGVQIPFPQLDVHHFNVPKG